MLAHAAINKVQESVVSRYAREAEGPLELALRPRRRVILRNEWELHMQSLRCCPLQERTGLASIALSSPRNYPVRALGLLCA